MALVCSQCLVGENDSPYETSSVDYAFQCLDRCRKDRYCKVALFNPGPNPDVDQHICELRDEAQTYTTSSFDKNKQSIYKKGKKWKFYQFKVKMKTKIVEFIIRIL